MSSKNREESDKIEEIISALIQGEMSDDESYDILVDGHNRVEVKSFYFFTGKARKLGKIKINQNTHENKSCNYYFFVGKSHKGQKIRMGLFLSWDEVDSLIKKYKLKAHRIPCGVSVFEMSWMRLLNPKMHRKMRTFE